MRQLRLGSLLASFMPGALLGCTIEKGPGADIGYGAADGCGATGASDNGSGGTGAKGNNPSGGKSNTNAGTTTMPEGGGGNVIEYDDCTRAWSAPVEESDCDLDALENSGETIGDVKGNYRVISKDTTLASGKTYKLDGLTVVESGVTLTVEKCVKVIGQSDTSVLVTDSGVLATPENTYTAQPPGRLVAVGEKNAPIVFTSWKAPGDRKPGDWGGIVMCGKAPENTWRNENSPPVSEGIAERPVLFGWKTDEYAAEDNGALSYVRIEYVGKEIGVSTETNGLTLNAVGSGTAISHVMVANAIDDCFEWFGGTVNADHLVAYNCDDDGFDSDLGFSGSVQFAFLRQYPTSLEQDSNGLEWDNNRINPKYVPVSDPKFANVTLCGGNTGDFLVNPRYGAVLRIGTGGSLLNTLLSGFDTAALSIRDSDTNPSMTYSTIFGNAQVYNNADTATRVDWFEPQEGNSLDAPPNMCDCRANPPLPFPVDAIEGAAPGAGYPDPEANYRGAFKDSTPESNWLTGKWVDWAEQ